MEAEQQAAVSQFRQQHRLLNAQQILGIRKKLGLTQADMEKLLGVGEKTVVRWERGTVFQGSSTDKLLRVIDNVHGAAEFLAQAHGVTLQRVDRPALSTPITPSASLGMRLHQEGPSVPLSDRQVLHMEDYRRRKADMKPVPRDMLQEAQL
jgi:DNA-binding transcriptional regulator YiaG